MLGILNPWKYGTIALAVAITLCFSWAIRLNSLRGEWEKKYSTLNGQSQTVLMAARQAADSPDLKWPDVPSQITALASSNLALKSSIDISNERIANLSADFAKAQASGEDLRKQLAAAQSARQDTMAKLRAMEAPGDRQSCPVLLKQAQQALDLVYGSGGQ